MISSLNIYPCLIIPNDALSQVSVEQSVSPNTIHKSFDSLTTSSVQYSVVVEDSYNHIR